MTIRERANRHVSAQLICSVFIFILPYYPFVFYRRFDFVFFLLAQNISSKLDSPLNH